MLVLTAVRAEAKQEGAAIWPLPRVLRQGSAGDLAKPEQFVIAPQGLFPAPLSPSQITTSALSLHMLSCILAHKVLAHRHKKSHNLLFAHDVYTR